MLFILIFVLVCIVGFFLIPEGPSGRANTGVPTGQEDQSDKLRGSGRFHKEESQDNSVATAQKQSVQIPGLQTQELFSLISVEIDANANPQELYALYEKYKGDEKNNRWLAYLTAAAQKHHPQAMGTLGMVLMSVYDWQGAFSYLQEAAKEGVADAVYSLSVIYANGYGVAKDEVKADTLFSQALELDSAMAQYGMHMRIEAQEFFRDNFAATFEEQNAKSLHWLQKSAEQQFVPAAAELGEAYFMGRMNLSRDFAQARRWLNTAISKEEEVLKWRNWLTMCLIAYSPDNVRVLLGVMDARGMGELQDDASAAQWFEQAKPFYQETCEEADYALAQLYLHGRLKAAGMQALEKAFELYRRCCNSLLRHLKSIQEFGIRYASDGREDISDEEIERRVALLDYDEPTEPGSDIAAIEALAQQGQAKSQYILGVRLLEQLPFASETDKAGSALQWLKAAAEQGHAKAQYQLGEVYAQGQAKVEPDVQEAVRWFEMAAENLLRTVNPYSPVLDVLLPYHEEEEEAFMWGESTPESRRYAALGTLCHVLTKVLIQKYKQRQGKGQGTPIESVTMDVQRPPCNGQSVSRPLSNQPEWAQLFERLFLFGEHEGQESEVSRLIDMLIPLAEQGDVDVQIALADVYDWDVKHARTDHHQAFEWRLKAAEQDSAQAQFQLAQMYLEGKGCYRDDRKALHWLKKAAEKSEDLAALQLGMLYLKGRGTMVDYREAAKWFEAAIDEDDEPQAYYELANLYMNGRLGRMDYGKAAELYAQAASEFLPELCDSVVDTGNRLYPQPQYDAPTDENSSLAEIERLAQRGQTNSQYIAGLRYAEGEGTDVDMRTAISWLERAAGRNHPLAQYELGLRYYKGTGVEVDYRKAAQYFQRMLKQVKMDI